MGVPNIGVNPTKAGGGGGNLSVFNQNVFTTRIVQTNSYTSRTTNLPYSEDSIENIGGTDINDWMTPLSDPDYFRQNTAPSSGANMFALSNNITLKRRFVCPNELVAGKTLDKIFLESIYYSNKTGTSGAGAVKHAGGIMRADGTLVELGNDERTLGPATVGASLENITLTGTPIEIQAGDRFYIEMEMRRTTAGTTSTYLYKYFNNAKDRNLAHFFLS